MPVIGPGNNEIHADEAYEKFLKLIGQDYHIFPDKLCNPGFFEQDMKEELQKLRAAIRGVFRLDSWDSW